MNGPRDLGERPTGGVSGLLYDAKLRMNVCRNHAYVEGFEVDDRAALRGYDRAEHPWMHGRRPHDLAERVRAVLP